ncbi:poly(ADP-ribose) glycohydrolase [Nesidiocoris tenuis]|uniref:ADP-ribosylhydrolase ARH3 n=1 Tax=Nesidiocoris tenuis TaxID=355587 RepID=A0ABN7AHC1_9HEMI|nr:poly(ADP-ribose) glycohydrolase [Nesidiocoris tenuis]
MVVPIIETAVLANKFRGCMLGSLLGDCLGSPFEAESGPVAKTILQKYFDKMEDPTFKSPVKRYTDDTAMTKSVAASLAQHGAFNEKDMAKRFATEYFQEPRRGYGEAVTRVFRKWRESKMEDVWKPAREQFDGQGSAGNGSGMRIAPVGLFCYRDTDLLVETAAKVGKLTHTHRLGYHGGILQALAVQLCVVQDSKAVVDTKRFCDDLIEKMSKLEPKDEDELNSFEQEPKSYQIQLKLMQKLLQKKDVDNDEVVEVLGNNVLSIYSIPTAIYCYLRAQQPIEFIKTDNIFRRVIQYAISLGGDTDTIASMAGALAGAHLGADSINANILKHCEGVDMAVSLADELLDAVNSPPA